MQKKNDFVQTVAEAIAETTLCNVTITDTKQRRIAGTGPYRVRIGEKVPAKSAFGETLRSRSTIVIEEPRKNEVCIQCQGRGECIEEYEICTPILRDNKVLGVIGIFANNKEQEEYIRARKSGFCKYAENMAKLLASHIAVESLLADNHLKNQELETIIEFMDNALLCLDEKGRVLNLNTAAARLFRLRDMKKDCIGRAVDQVVGTSNLFRRAVYTGEELRDVEDVVETVQGETVSIFASVKRKRAEEQGFIIITAMDAKTLQRAAVRHRESSTDTTFEVLVGKSQIMRRIIGRAQIAAAYDSTILITGESGTGKELFARAIHRESPRSGAPFISINCSAIPESLLESELFGYEAGAFTGASAKGKVGKMELANHGTLFLDEIGDMPLFLQVKLLRVLQERKIMKIGGTRYLDLDIRIIAATNQDLEEMIRKQEFREDLYYRLNVIPLQLPSLRQRKSDIPELAEYFLRFFNDRFGKQIRGFTDEALKIMENYGWRGNVRELENVVEYLVNFSAGPFIDAEEVGSRIQGIEERKQTLEEQVREYERQLIKEKLTEYGNTAEAKEQAARELGISLATLYRKISVS